MLDILKKLGIIDSKSLQEYFLSKKDNLTQEDIDVLSPDVIDNKTFWKIAPTLDNSSIVGGGYTSDNIDNVNYWNSILAKTIGIFDYIIPNIEHEYRLLDIGCGYCPIKTMLSPQISYTGIDIVQRLPEVVETDGNGIPDLGMFDYIISCNVFQHLSLKQKIQYTKDAFKYLNPGGYFINAFLTSFGTNHMPKFNNVPCIFTCGQFLPVITHVKYMEILMNEGLELKQFNNRFDGFSCFISRKPNVISTN